MLNSITKTVSGDFSLGTACQFVGEHWDFFESGIGLNIDLKYTNFIDPAILGLALQVNRCYPNSMGFSNAGEGAKAIIKRVHGDDNPGTIFPASPIGAYVNGELLARLKYWISLVLNRFYGAPKNSSAFAVKLTAVELINNVIDHAEAAKGGIIVGASFRKRKHFELTVIDFGKTIPATLEGQFPGCSDHEILAHALEFGVSRRKGSEHNYGRGLDIIKSYALQDRESSLVMVSRNGFLSITNAELPHARKSRYTFPGTIVKCSFSEKFVEQILEEPSKREELEF